MRKAKKATPKAKKRANRVRKVRTPQFFCEVCERSFGSAAGLGAHRHYKHTDKPVPDPFTPAESEEMVRLSKKGFNPFKIPGKAVLEETSKLKDGMEVEFVRTRYFHSILQFLKDTHDAVNRAVDQAHAELDRAADMHLRDDLRSVIAMMKE